VFGDDVVFFFDAGPFFGCACAVDVFDADAVLQETVGGVFGGLESESVVA